MHRIYGVSRVTVVYDERQPCNRAGKGASERARLMIHNNLKRPRVRIGHALDSHCLTYLVSLLQVIPADRRPPEKEETWTLASDQQDPCAFFDDTVESKAPRAAAPQDPEKTRPTEAVISAVDNAGDNADNTLPRSQETRKSKTKKVKSYLRKCKGALSKGDEGVAEKRRQENCTSWYLDDVAPCASNRPENRDADRYTEFPEERLREQARDLVPVEDPAPETLGTSPPKGANLDETPDEALARLLEEDRRADLNRSRTSLYEDAKDSEQCAPDEKTPIKEPERFRDDEKKDDAVSLETLTTEDTNLNKCDSSDTLIAETTETAVDPDAITVAEDAEKHPEVSVDGDEEEATLPVPAFCGVSYIGIFQ